MKIPHCIACSNSLSQFHTVSYVSLPSIYFQVNPFLDFCPHFTVMWVRGTASHSSSSEGICLAGHLILPKVRNENFEDFSVYSKKTEQMYVDI